MPRLQSPVAVISMVLAVFVALMVGAPVGAHAQPAGNAAPAKRVAPPGYGLRVSSSKLAPAGARTRGMVNCPKGTVPLSGGAVTLDDNLQLNLGDSFPAGRAWVVDMSNASATDAQFQVTAACARKPMHYKLVRGHQGSLPPGSSEEFLATCPTGSKPLGGGVSIASTENGSVDTGVNMAGSRPDGRQWLVQGNNEGMTNSTATVMVVCGSLPNYRVVTSRDQNVPAQSQGMANATCPAPTVVVGGGGSTHVLGSVDLAWSTMNEGFDWFTAINNPTDGNADVKPVVVCAS